MYTRVAREIKPRAARIPMTRPATPPPEMLCWPCPCPWIDSVKFPEEPEEEPEEEPDADTDARIADAYTWNNGSAGFALRGDR